MHHFRFMSNCMDGKAGVPHKMNIELHTVSKLCDNKQGWGVPMSGTWSIDSGGLCLVDSISLLINDGTPTTPQTRFTWSGSGRFGSNWLINCMDEGIGAYVPGIHHCADDWSLCDS